MKDDVISRQAAIDLLKQMRKDGDMVPWEGKDVFARIRKLPSAEPQRIRGHWIDVNDSYNRISGRCSACGWESHMYEDDVVGMNFCPNCGADMRGEQHE